MKSIQTDLIEVQIARSTCKNEIQQMWILVNLKLDFRIPIFELIN
jgi:hypothetical protein